MSCENGALIGTVSSQGPCSCPEDYLVHVDCPRHGYQFDYADNPGGHDHLACYWDYKWRKQRQLVDELASQTVVPETVMHMEDVLLSYMRYSPRVSKNWTPPKLTLAQRLRAWRWRANRRVQQWIHDHLPEASCND